MNNYNCKIKFKQHNSYYTQMSLATNKSSYTYFASIKQFKPNKLNKLFYWMQLTFT